MNKILEELSYDMYKECSLGYLYFQISFLVKIIETIAEMATETDTCRSQNARRLNKKQLYLTTSKI